MPHVFRWVEVHKTFAFGGGITAIAICIRREKPPLRGAVKYLKRIVKNIIDIIRMLRYKLRENGRWQLTTQLVAALGILTLESPSALGGGCRSGIEPALSELRMTSAFAANSADFT